MSDYEDKLLRDVMNQHGHTLDQADYPPHQGRRARGVLRRPRVLAGGSLGLAGIGAALLLVLGAGGAAAPTQAFAITKHSDGSVLVQLNSQEDLGQANQKLAAMGINEQITLYPNPSPTAYRGVQNCTAAPGTSAPNPPIKFSVITNDADNTGVTGAVTCVVGPGSDSGSSSVSGNS
jgi:hypothetical protein